MAANGAHAHLQQTKRQSTLPSPTLTNPELVLPIDIPPGNALTPPRSTRPPSLSYLYEQRERHDRELSTLDPDRNRKIELLSSSRKRSLRRSTSGYSTTNPSANNTMRMIDASSPDVPLGSSPTVFPERTSSRQHLAPSPANTMQRKPSNASSAFTFDLDKIPNYQFDGEDSDIGTLDGYSDGTATPTRDHSPSFTRDAQGRARQRVERSSQELSKRAEMILANAKKRLNVSPPHLCWWNVSVVTDCGCSSWTRICEVREP